MLAIVVLLGCLLVYTVLPLVADILILLLAVEQVVVEVGMLGRLLLVAFVLGALAVTVAPAGPHWVWDMDQAGALAASHIAL
jgi:hypothetical protein